MTAQPTCADRIADHLQSRIGHIAALTDLADCHDETRLAEILEDTATREAFCELGYREMFADDVNVPEPLYASTIAAFAGDVLEDLLAGFDLDALREAAETAMDELPLGVSAQTVFRIDISTGGPADWLEIVCTGDTPRYEAGGEPYDPITAVYHFADWFDHAEQTLEDSEEAAAFAFAMRVVPELAG